MAHRNRFSLLAATRVARSLALVAAVAGALSAARPAWAQDDAEAQEKYQALLESGQQQFQEGDYNAAVATFSQAITATQGYDPSPLLLRAKAYALLKEYPSALEDLKNALTYAQSRPGLLPEIQSTRGEVYLELKAYQNALPDLQAAAAADRSNPQYQFDLGKALVYLGGVDEGQKALTRYLDAEQPEDAPEEETKQRAEALRLRGQAYGALGKKEKAAADFASSLEIDSESYETYFARASLALQAKEYQPAVEDLARAIDLYKPQDEDDKMPFVQGRLTRAFALEELGKAADDEESANRFYADELAECDQLLDEMPETETEAILSAQSATLFRKGVAERLLGQLGDAVRSFSRALQLNPALGEGYFRRGVCFFYLGEEKLAIRDFEQAAAINFDSPRSNLWKGLAWARLGDYDQAVRAYGASIAVSDRYVPAYVNRGLAQMQRGEFEKAIADFNEAIRLQPTEATHYYRRGRAYSLDGQHDKAIQSLMNAIEFDAELKAAYDALSGELDANGQSQLASEYRRRAAELAE